MKNRKLFKQVLFAGLGLILITGLGLFLINHLGKLGLDNIVTYEWHEISNKSNLYNIVEFQEIENIYLGTMLTVFIIFILSLLLLISIQIWFSHNLTRAAAEKNNTDMQAKLMLESTPMLFAIWDNKGMPIDCNGETLRVLGLSSRSEYVDHFFDLSPKYQPDGELTRCKASRIIKKTLQTGFERVEWMLRNSAGEDVPVEATVVRVPLKDDYCLAVYARDLREEKEIESYLKESEKRLKMILESMATPCYFFDPEGELIDCNHQAVHFFGFEDKEEFIKEFFNLSPEYHSDGNPSIDKAKTLIRQAFEKGKNAFIWEHVKKDGTRLLVEVFMEQVEWIDGYRVVAYTRDLSKLVETDNNLRKTQAVVEASPNLIMFLSQKGNIEYMNPSMTSVTGFSREELEKEGLSLIFSNEDYERLNNEYINAALKMKSIPTNFEMEVIEKSGKILDFSFSVYGIQLYDGSAGLGLVGRDITHLKWMQHNLEAAKEQAEKSLVSEIKYNKAKSDFLSRVSHELRTPLNAIIGVAKVAGKLEEKTEMAKCFNKITEASGNLLWLVNNIIDITSYDTGVLEFKTEPFSFSKVMTTVTESIKAKAQNKEQIFNVKFDNGITDLLQSDEHRLKQILLNLLLNALKFTPEKGRIDFSAKELSNDGNECVIRFEIIDNGIGISKELLGQLGDIFEQADNSITREHGGLGLGLSLTKRIVKMMNGTISAESEHGKGTRFICDVSLGIAKNKVLETYDEDQSSMDLSGKRILIVDDVKINREILMAMLDDTGAVLHQASTGDEAVKMFSEDMYNLVLMDLHMPVMDGFSATKNIRSGQHPWAKIVPVISVSADNSRELNSKCSEAGINDHIAKPVNTQSLYRVISKWMPAISA